jgi:hypothetical protein
LSAPEFTPYGKTPRLFRDMVVTEKIDGTNAGIRVTDDGAIIAQSRNRIITPDADNHGFAAWVAEHAGVLTDVLGPGLHFGEWWGSGIGRGYDLPKGEKRLSLFNVKRWEGQEDELGMVPGLGVVPVLHRGTFNTRHVQIVLEHLKASGSVCAPGFMRPEGVVVFHSQAGQVFKVLAEGDEYAKSQLAAVAA